jgi:hypothetical protein
VRTLAKRSETCVSSQPAGKVVTRDSPILMESSCLRCAVCGVQRCRELQESKMFKMILETRESSHRSQEGKMTVVVGVWQSARQR